MSNYQKFFEDLTKCESDKKTNKCKLNPCPYEFHGYSDSTRGIPKEKTYGDIWETKVGAWFLKNDPYWKTQFKHETIMSPQKWGYGIKSSKTRNLMWQDLGIDLVAEDHNGKMWGIQAKCYTVDIPIKEINSFLGAMGATFFNFNNPKITKTFYKGLLLITNNISDNARSKLKSWKTTNGSNRIVEVGPTYFKDSELKNWDDSINETSTKSVYKKKCPLPHQKEALGKIKKRWKHNDRGKCIMACGTGKTLVGLRAAEEVNSKLTLVMLPSLSLVNQISKDWLKDAIRPISPLFVCSDPTVKKYEDPYISNTSDLGVPVTTDPKDIVKFLNKTGSDHRVVFSTYQSSKSIQQAQILGAPKFDLIIADEAHHCAGLAESYFASVLYNSKINSRKRLFMTATPRIATPQLKWKAKEDDHEITSMDNEDHFGPTFHHLTFGTAIKKGLLANYQIVVNFTTEQKTADMIRERDFVTLGKGLSGNAENLGGVGSFIKLIEEYDISHAITFHNTIQDAKDESELLKGIFPLMDDKYKSDPPYIQHVEGKEMTTKQRADILERFRETKDGINILTNAKCLTEGVDIRAIDCIGFIAPKSSQIDILQAVGRAIRKRDDDKPGTIFIPVFIPNSEINDPELVLENSRFQTVFKVVRALMDHDENFAAEMNNLREKEGERKNTGTSDRLPPEFIIDKSAKIDPSFYDKIETLLILKTTQSWHEYYGALLDWKKEHPDEYVPDKLIHNGLNIGMWAGTMRVAARPGYKGTNIVTDEQRKKLNDADFIWDPLEYMWNKHYEALLDWKKEHPDEHVPARLTHNGLNIGTWADRIRAADRPGSKGNVKITDEQRKKLNDADFIWDPLEYSWNKHYEALLDWKKEHPDESVPQKLIHNGLNIGTWASNIRAADRPGSKGNVKITDEQRKKLNDADFIWDPLEYMWNKHYEALLDWKKEHPDEYVPANLIHNGLNIGTWANSIRTADRPGSKGTGIVTDEQRKKLNDVGFIWEPRKDMWNKYYEALLDWKKEHPEESVPNKLIHNGLNIGIWANTIRFAARPGYKGTYTKVTDEQRKKLNDADFIWEPREHAKRARLQHKKG